jgi:hypothetical protein
MGDDAEIVVVGLRVDNKFPAIDLMEFIEKVYHFVLDSDMSTGEEHDGKYQVFVEIERNEKLPGRLNDLFRGISKLTDCYDWKFRYQKSNKPIEFSPDTIRENVPTSKDAYEKKMLEYRTRDLQEFFNKGIVDVKLENDNTVTFSRPYSGNLKAKFVSLGKYNNLKKIVPGAIDLSEGSQGEIIFLSKFLGHYDIDKIDNKFLIRNGNQAVIIEKDTW